MSDGKPRNEGGRTTGADSNVGRLLAKKYQLVRLLGEGGMGAVYEGRNQIGKRVAIKLLLEPELRKSPELIARFFREAQAAAAVESRHVVDVYDTGVDEETGIPFIIMAHLAGEDFEQVVRRVGALNPFAAARIATQAAAGLARAHEAGIIHRDIKPANLFLADNEGESVVKILDFGIAKLGAEGGAGVGGAASLTRSGALLGTPLYMSPEQAQGLKSIDARTDVWSLGMCLYQGLAGRLPFGDVDTVGRLIVEIVTHDVPALSALAPWVRPELAAVIHQALERDVSKRIPTARAFMAALAPFINGSTTLTPDLLVAARESLDRTLSQGSLLPPSLGAPVSGATLPLSAPSLTPLPASVTTGGLSQRGERLALAPKPESRGRLLALIAAGLVAACVGGVAWFRFGSKDQSTTARGSSAASVSDVASMTSPPPEPPATAANVEKVGVLTLKMPSGYSVKVDGSPPGAPRASGGTRLLGNGKLELRGEFQTRFIVAIVDKNGEPVMSQEVYLYDDRLDPDIVDTSVGKVPVMRPKRAVGAPSPTSSAGTTNTAGLPARF